MNFLNILEINQLVVAALVMFSAGIIQGTVAFGFSLFSVPLLLMVGFPVPITISIICLCSAMQSVDGVQRLRHAILWDEVKIALILRIIGMIIGIIGLNKLLEYPPAQIKFWVGFVVFSLAIIQIIWQPKPKEHLHNNWRIISFLSSGFTEGLTSMGGPPLVLWVTAHNWTADQMRAFLFACFMSIAPFQMVAYYWNFGNQIIYGVLLAIIFLPIVLLGSSLGLQIGTHFSKGVLKNLAFSLLIIISISVMLPYLNR